MLSFHTNIDRLQPWIKALDMLYYDNLGRDGSEYRVVWADEPPEWTDRNSIENIISIELHTIHEQQNTLLYKLTFFITTGTIIVQDQNYQMFVDHFKLLSQILEQVIITESNIPSHNDINAEKNILEIGSHDSDNTCVKTVVSEQNEVGKNTKINSTDDNNNLSDHTHTNVSKESIQVVGHEGEDIRAVCSI
ncbi:unnamed protein product [Mytilus coruscus]|uniref:Uncharacterized protein n=1 Tax=Mytilus coruscus TaxID=42192 RepID=A0A6J8E0N4_MYTCO|nr:unnamed protein product [Mytilus coruscus]